MSKPGQRKGRSRRKPRSGPTGPEIPQSEADLGGTDPGAPDLSAAIGQASRRHELEDPDLGMSSFDRRVNQVAEAVGVAVLILITVLIFTNAVLRYAFATSFIWGDELAIGSIPWLAFIGLFLSVRRRRFIRIGFFVDNLPPRIQQALTLFSHVLSALVFAYLSWGAFSYVSLFGGDATTYMKLPKGVFQSALLIGGIAVALAFLLPVRRRFRDDQSAS
ncbi:TRAP transporter small permease [Fodinicurvata sp. EGI_FJ10296]|uniref:TRAP transporter small permease n=1 Tax=Fodinicurvata sp. EGI_FJ10296 TaxID=3231908 RepID=UPI003454710F